MMCKMSLQSGDNEVGLISIEIIPWSPVPRGVVCLKNIADKYCSENDVMKSFDIQ